MHTNHRLLFLCVFACYVVAVLGDPIPSNMPVINGIVYSPHHHLRTRAPARNHNQKDRGVVRKIISALLDHNGKPFCSSFLHITPVRKTVTVTKTYGTTTLEEKSTVFSTTTIVGFTKSVEEDVTVTKATTVMETISSFTTLTTFDATVTGTTFIATTTIAELPLRKRNDPELGQELVARSDRQLPWYLKKYAPRYISSACSKIVTTPTITEKKTKSVEATKTITSVITEVATQMVTTTVPFTSTEVTSVTITETDIIPGTVIITATATTLVSATETIIPGCDPSNRYERVSSGGINVAGGSSDYDPNITDADACCIACYTSANCNIWIRFEGFGCIMFRDTPGSNADTACPLGKPPVVIGTDPTESISSVAGPGPCSDGVVSGLR